MTNVFIFHGVGGHPQENWFPWLEKQLQASGQNVIIPQFPTQENQTLENWLAVLEQYNEQLTPDSILVGHSLGVPFTLNVLEKYQVTATFLVAGFVGVAGNEFDDSMKTFAQREFDWDAIRKNCQHFTLYHSDNDPYIALDKPQRIADSLEMNITLVKGAGHFNESAGYTTFEQLYTDIQLMQQK